MGPSSSLKRLRVDFVSAGGWAYINYAMSPKLRCLRNLADVPETLAEVLGLRIVPQHHPKVEPSNCQHSILTSNVGHECSSACAK